MAKVYSHGERTITHFTLHLLSVSHVSNSSPLAYFMNALANSKLGHFYTARTQRFASWVWPMVLQKLGSG